MNLGENPDTQIQKYRCVNDDGCDDVFSKNCCGNVNKYDYDYYIFALWYNWYGIGRKRVMFVSCCMVFISNDNILKLEHFKKTQ